jgi:hypothetical protein
VAERVLDTGTDQPAPAIVADLGVGVEQDVEARAVAPPMKPLNDCEVTGRVKPEIANRPGTLMLLISASVVPQVPPMCAPT